MRAEAEIKFECSGCGQRLSVHTSGEGAATNCPSCQAPLMVPQIESLSRTAALTNGAGPWQEGNGRPVRGSDAMEPDASLLREKLHDSEHNRRRVQRDLATSRVEIASLQNQLRKASDEQERLTSLLTALQEENRVLQKARSELVLEKEEMHRYALVQDTELATRAQKLRDVQQSLEKLECERDSLGQAVAALREEAADLRQKTATVDALTGEVERLRRDIAASSAAHEFKRLRERAEAAETGQQAKERELDACRSAMVQLTDMGEALRRELKTMQERCSAAELRAESRSREKMQQDNSVLRAVLARQKEELEHCYTELKRFRRAQLGLRLAYTIFALGLLGVAALAWRIAPGISEALQ